MWKKLTFTGILFFLCGSVRADYIEVRRDNVAIKAAPERDAEEVARVALGTKLDLVGDNQTDGYYEVRLPEGGTGWIYRTLVRRSSGRVMPGGTVTATKLASGFKPVTALPTPLQNLAVLHAVDHTCPIEGDAVKPMHRAQNRAKNNFYATGTLVAVSRATFVALQNKAEDRGVAFGSSNSLPNNRDDLRSLVSVNGTMIGEGTVVRYVGFIVDAHHSNLSKGESVNCKVGGEESNDIHIQIGQSPNDEACDTITAEISPHFRPVTWNRIGQLRVQDRPVRFTGQLFFDASHVPCRPGKPASPPRISIWEIHPVYAVDICLNKKLDSCKPGDAAAWQPLHEWVGDEEDEEER